MKRPALMICALSAVFAQSVFAGPVTPDGITAAGTLMRTFPGRAPTIGGSGDDQATPGAFSHSSSGSTSVGTGNRTSAGFSYDDEYFFRRSPLGPADLIHLKGWARASAESAIFDEPLQATATSYSEARFTVTEPVAFRLSGYISIDQITAGGPGAIISMVGTRLTALLDAGGPPQITDAFLTQPLPGFTLLDLTGILQPGRYRFETSASVATLTTGRSSAYRAEVSFDALIEFTPIPAPGSLAILGLPGLIATRRRR